jgi:hypothetical protein
MAEGTQLGMALEGLTGADADYARLVAADLARAETPIRTPSRSGWRCMEIWKYLH